MHLRKLVLACGLATFALSNYASALGLGEVKIKSSLNQPLDAELQLLDTNGLTAEQIIVSLASIADFERNGVERLYFYTELKFQVVMDHPGGPIVKVTTQDAVREPYLNFLVEAKWTSGRFLREYTLLVDLPTFDTAAPVAVESAQISKAAKVKPVTPAEKPKATPAVSAPTTTEPSATATEEKPEIIAEQDVATRKAKVSAGTYGPIADKDTLWDIARAVNPDKSVSIHQTMLALQRLNPNAFINGNINLIKKGQVLRVPDVAEATSISKADAAVQYSAQLAQASGTASTASTGLGAQLDGASHATAEHHKAEPVSGRVKLEAPSAHEKSANGQGSGANKGSGKALESELAATLEELDKAKSEKTELSSRVHDLEDQVKTMQRLVDVSNEKLRAMQLTAAKQAEKQAEKPAEKVAVKEPVVPPKPEPVVASSVAQVASSSAEVSSEQAASSVAAEVPKKVAPKPVVKSIPVEPEKSIVDLLMDNILWIGLGVVAVAGVGFALVRRRSSQAAESKAKAQTDDLFESEPNFDAFNHYEQEEPEQEAPVEDMSLFEEEESAVAETSDVVGEADIYIAYGKYDQAEEMLLNGLAKDSSSVDIRLKLLEVYSQTKNAAEFDKHYAAILPLATGFALNRASELRANIPGAGEFNDVTVIAPPKVKPAPNLTNDFSLDDDFSSLSSAPNKSADADLSFDLDLEDDDELAAVDIKTSTSNYGMDDYTSKPTSSSASSADEFSLDFDLDDESAEPAEDLSDISLALDSLDDGLPEDVELPSDEDEFKFDFNDSEFESTSKVEAKQTVSAPEPIVEPSADTDLSFDMDDEEIDLASLDSDLAMLDEKSSAPAPQAQVSAEENEFDWDDDEDDALATIDLAEEELPVDDDDFDIDAPSSDVSLKDLDAEFEDDDLGFDESAFAELDAEFGEEDDAPAEVAKLAEPEVEEELEDIADDDVFDQALSDFSAESLAMDDAADMSDDDMDAELDFMADADEAATKLDLARAYIDMGDNEGARDILAEVAHEGNDQQRQEAVDLLSRIDV